MCVHEIHRRWTTRLIASIEAPSLEAAVVAAASRGISLLYADLRNASLAELELTGADFRGADLAHIDARGANLAHVDARSARLVRCRLEGATLRGADLRGADLSGADLRRTDLRGARLTGADLRTAKFQGARLAGARMDWRWSVLPLELLRQHPQVGDEGSRAVSELAFAGDDERPFAWLKTLLLRELATDLVLAALAEHVRSGDNAPSLLRGLAADVAPTVVDPPAVWTVRRQFSSCDVRQPA